MGEAGKAHDRSQLMDHWKPEMSASERAEMLAAWQAYRSCADCQHWGDPDDREAGDVVHCCALERYASLVVPADFTCAQWEAAHA